MSFTVVIPARYASSRLPAKPLALIANKPMIQHVYERASESGAARVIVATDDQRIFDLVRGFGGEACMTKTSHVSGTDRLHEVAGIYAMAGDEIVVNVQGDEPLIPATVIRQVAKNLAQNTQASVATLCEPITSAQEFTNPNAVKVVTSADNLALYFSRAPIPWPRDQFSQNQDQLPEDLTGTIGARRHIGIYAYRVSLLNRFITWPAAPLELLESLEQLRVLWQGESIHVDLACDDVPGGVDTLDDLQRVRDLLESQ